MPAIRPSLLLPALAALVNATVWGIAWYPLQWLEDHGVPALWTTLLVFSVCTAGVLAYRPQALRQAWRTPQLLWLALAAGLTNVCFNMALAGGDVVRSVLLFYLMPMWVVLLARWLLHEAITPMAIARVVLALAGAVLVLGQGRAMIPLPDSLADWLALVAGFCFGLNNVLLRRLAETPREARSLAMFGGAVICAPIGMALMAAYGTAPVFAPQAVAWIGLLLFAALVLVGNLALQYGAARLQANVLSMLMLSEILVATLSSWIAGAATLSPVTLGGGALIIGASLLAIRSPPARAAG